MIRVQGLVLSRGLIGFGRVGLKLCNIGTGVGRGYAIPQLHVDCQEMVLLRMEAPI